jgi:hypothetical protein
VVLFGVLLGAFAVFDNCFFKLRAMLLAAELKQPGAKADGDRHVIEGAPDTVMFARYRAADLRDWASRYTDRGLRYYIASQYQFDVAFPFVYGFAFVFWITLPWEYARTKGVPPDRRGEPSRGLLALLVLPAFAVLFDFAENITVISLVDNLPGGAMPPTWEWWGNAAGWFTLLKWVFCALSLIAGGVGLLVAYWFMWKGRHS